VLWIGNSQLANWCSKFLSWTTNPGKRLIYGLLSTFGFTIGSVYILTAIFNWLTNFNVEFTRDVLYSTVPLTYAVSMFMHGKEFLENWRKAALDAETLKKESAVARYESLKSQVNPHFLFNSFNALTNLVYEDQDKAAKFIKQLSEVYRYVLDTREKETVSIQEELRFVKSYLYLQEIRFGDNLKVKLDLDNASGNVAPLALQLLLENAIKHNIVSHENPLFVEMKVSDGFIWVENKLLRKFVLGENSSGMGLNNIRNRYKFLSNKEVIVNESEEKFSVGVPVIEIEEA
jgi:LytS/YehU family sensor histidine kinase